MKYVFAIKKIDCPHCAHSLEVYLSKILPFKELSINFLMEKLTVEVKNNETEEEAFSLIENALKDAPVFAKLEECD